MALGHHVVMVLATLLMTTSGLPQTSNRRGLALQGPADRTLHIRSIPPVSGYNSHIYEVLMTPYIDKSLASNSKRAVSLLRSAEGQEMGEMEMRESRTGLQLSGTLKGLTPGQHLGVSVHESGDCRQPGPIFRPDQPEDGLPSPAMPAGFVGSILVDESGKVALSFSLGPRLSLSGHRSVLARSVALFPLVEPGQPRHNVPVACGVVGRALPSPAETAAARRRRHFFHLPGVTKVL